MPIYEYRCPNGHVFEVFKRMADPAPDACETCDASPVEQVLYPVAIHYKGSGFYSTDYGRGGRKQGKEGTDGGASTGDSSGGDAGKSDKAETSKPAEKKAAAAD